MSVSSGAPSTISREVVASGASCSGAGAAPTAVRHDTGRRTALVAALVYCSANSLAALAEPPSPFTKMDAFQLKASYNGLNDALASWAVEIAAVQLGNEPASVVAAAGLSDANLKHFSETSLQLLSVRGVVQEAAGRAAAGIVLGSRRGPV